MLNTSLIDYHNEHSPPPSILRSTVQIPTYMYPFISIPMRYKVAYGGRGAAKSHSVSRVLLAKGLTKRSLFVCAREVQKSIEDSVYRMICGIIYEDPVFSRFYQIKANKIVGINGTEFLFVGLQQKTISNIKSMPFIDVFWIEEGDAISARSWEVIVPTVREEGSEIWITYNPNLVNQAIHKYFNGDAGPPENSIVLKVSWRDNPWFPDVLNLERLQMMRTDLDRYMHVWEGFCRTYGDAQIFQGKWCVEKFVPCGTWGGPYNGLDFGFIHPLAITSTYVDLSSNTLYVYQEAGGRKIDLHETYKYIDKIDGVKTRHITADCSRPESISYLNKNTRYRKGPMVRVKASTKWKNSVEDGIAWMRSFNRIVIHPQCTNVAKEMSLYSYKLDPLTDEVTQKIIKENDHFIDSIRYGCDKLITSRATIFDAMNSNG